MTSLPIPADYTPKASLDDFDTEARMSPDAIFYNAIYEHYKNKRDIKNKESFFCDIFNEAYLIVSVVKDYKRPCLHCEEVIEHVDNYDFSPFCKYSEFLAIWRKIAVLSIVYQLLRETSKENRGVERFNAYIKTHVVEMEKFYGTSFFKSLYENYSQYLTEKEQSVSIQTLQEQSSQSTLSCMTENDRLKLEVEALREKEEILHLHLIEYNKVIASLKKENKSLKEENAMLTQTFEARVSALEENIETLEAQCAESPFIIARGKQTSILVILEAMYNAGWICRSDGSKYESHDVMIEDMMRILFNRKETKNIKQLLNSARNRTYDGKNKYFDELLSYTSKNE